MTVPATTPNPGADYARGTILHPVPDAPNFQLMLYDGGDTGAQEKVLAQLAKGGSPKPRKPAHPVGLSLPGGHDFPVAQRRAYEAAMGRTWEEIDPEPRQTDFGGPMYPQHPIRPRRLYDRRAHAQAQAQYDADRAQWSDKLYQYQADFADWYWRASDAYAEWQAARDYWRTRREQFSWTGRSKRDRPLTELVSLTIDGEPT